MCVFACAHVCVMYVGAFYINNIHVRIHARSSPVNCTIGESVCVDLKFITTVCLSDVCDGIIDCMDGSDELECPGSVSQIHMYSLVFTLAHAHTHTHTHRYRCSW